LKVLTADAVRSVQFALLLRRPVEACPSTNKDNDPQDREAIMSTKAITVEGKAVLVTGPHLRHAQKRAGTAYGPGQTLYDDQEERNR
jgi:hypothetical protein